MKNLLQVHKGWKDAREDVSPLVLGWGSTTDTEKTEVFNTVSTSVFPGKAGLLKSQIVWSKEDLPLVEGY